MRFSHRDAGSFAPQSVTEPRRAGLGPLPWSWLNQVHGARVLRAVAPGDHAGEQGDALVTSEPGCALAVMVADCAPVVLVAPGEIAIAHAGWRGLEAGVVASAFEALAPVDPADLRAVVGPHIGPECYEFGEADLERLMERFGPSVRSEAASGLPAFDVGAAVSTELGRLGISQVEQVGGCTSCEADRYFSHRARRDPGRHAMVAWMETTS